jgi:outer membrane protein assembly factor BamA
MTRLLPLVLLALVARGLAAEVAPLEVRRVKILGNKTTSTALILSYCAELREGKRVAARSLDRTLERIRMRLLLTKWFYAVEAYAVPGKDGKGVVIVLEVEEGYLYRYWGGAIYAGFGKANLGGRGAFFGVEAGYNRQTAIYQEEFLFSRPAYLRIVAGNLAVPYLDGASMAAVQKVGAQLGAGARLPRDLRVGLILDYGAHFETNYAYRDQALWAGARLQFDRKDDFFSSRTGASAELQASALAPHGAIRASAEGAVYIPLAAKLVWAIRGKIAIQPPLAAVGPLYRLSYAGQNGVRADYHAGMGGDLFWLASQEIRWRPLRGKLFQFMDVTLEPALYFDAGRAYDLAPAGAFGKKVSWAVGIAPRIFLGIPIFLPLRPEISFDDTLHLKFFFSVESVF